MVSSLTAAMAWSVLLFARAGDADAAEAPPSEQQIADAIRDLGHEQFTVREQASRFLIEAGRAAEPALNEALKSNDPEVVARARRILRRFMLGIYPDTPRDVVELIGKFYRGDADAKHAALDRLMAMGRLETVMKLIKAEPDATLRQALTKNLVKDLDSVGGGLFLAGNWSRAEDLLALGAVDERGMRNHAAYWLMRGQIDAAIERTRRAAAAGPGDLDRRHLVFLLRAKGDLEAALAVAEKTEDPELIEPLLFELGRWPELARRYDKQVRQPDGSLAGGVVELGFAAAYHRLAGNCDEFEAAVAAIGRLAESKPNKLRDCAEALLINERYEEAVELYRKHGGDIQFDILCRQRRYREAFREIGIEDPGAKLVPWQLDGPESADNPFAQPPKRFSLGIRVAPVLVKLDRRDEARGLLNELARAAEQSGDLSMQPVCSAEVELGWVDEACRHAALELARRNSPSLLRTLFPEHDDAAQVWWTFLRKRDPEQPAEQTLDRIRSLLGVPRAAQGGEAPDNSWREDVTAADQAGETLGGRTGREWLAALADTCLIHGDRRLARQYLERAAEAEPAADICLRLGDLLAEDGAGAEAASWYRRAWDADPKQPLGLYLAGRQLDESGQNEEGRRLMEVARLAPLGNERTRYQLAKGLGDRGLDEEATRQWEWILRTGAFRSWSVNEAGKYLGNQASGKDNHRAAAYWERLLLSCLQTSTGIIDVSGYLQVIHVIHKARARGFLAEGRIAEAVRELEAARAALPGETKLAMDMVPKLDELGEKDHADALFDRVFAALREICEDFPQSPTWRNNAAWMAARCNRKLDEALAHAQRATALAPDKAAYLDTLAEVHFRRGEPEKAVELARRCIELEPEREFYREQLERFEKGEPSTASPAR